MKNLRVLVVDDNSVNLKIMVRALHGLGHTGVIVNDGDKAIRCMSGLNFDLVLLDVTMPGMDGLETLSILRAQERAKQSRIPVIMVTGHDMPGDWERFIAGGADGYVCKPVDVALLDKEIRRVVPSF